MCVAKLNLAVAVAASSAGCVVRGTTSSLPLARLRQIRDPLKLLIFRVRRSRGEMYIGHGHLCVCLSLAAFHTIARTWMLLGGMVGGALYCALLGGFAIGARVSLLWQHSAEREMYASACTRSVPALFFDYFFSIFFSFSIS